MSVQKYFQKPPRAKRRGLDEKPFDDAGLYLTCAESRASTLEGAALASSSASHLNTGSSWCQMEGISKFTRKGVNGSPLDKKGHLPGGGIVI